MAINKHGTWYSDDGKRYGRAHDSEYWALRKDLRCAESEDETRNAIDALHEYVHRHDTPKPREKTTTETQKAGDLLDGFLKRQTILGVDFASVENRCACEVAAAREERDAISAEVRRVIAERDTDAELHVAGVGWCRLSGVRGPDEVVLKICSVSVRNFAVGSVDDVVKLTDDVR